MTMQHVPPRRQPARPKAGFPNYQVYRSLITSLPPAYRRDVKLAVQIELVRQNTNDYAEALAAIFQEHATRWASVLSAPEARPGGESR